MIFNICIKQKKNLYITTCKITIVNNDVNKSKLRIIVITKISSLKSVVFQRCNVFFCISIDKVISTV